MIKRPNHRNLIGRRRQPFWLPATNFYILAVAISALIFFLVWGILRDGEETPWIPAGLLASFVLGTAVFVREIVLRTRRNQLLLAQEQLDFNLKNVYQQKQNQQDENKLTLEKNATILNEIAKKSAAANILGKFAEAHWEVFELCHQYLNLTERELVTVRVGSPRLPALTRGREKVQGFHKFHLLAWSAAESRSLIQEAKSSATMSKKLELAMKALNIIDSAIEFYPNESQLLESAAAVSEFITTIKVSHWIEQAERFAFKGNYKRAINNYRDALFYLARENIRSGEREVIAEKINLEIEKIGKILSQQNEPKS